METLYIVLGAFSSIFIFLLGYAAKGVFDLKKKSRLFRIILRRYR